MLKKISSIAGGGHHHHRSSSVGVDLQQRSIDEERHLGHTLTAASERGTKNEVDDLRNAMEMLIAENKHLKGIIQERDTRPKTPGSDGSQHEDLRALRAECEEAKNKVDRLQRELQLKEELIESLKRDEDLVHAEKVQELTKKVSSLEAQLQFECQSHSEELQEKEARIAELEMQLLDAQQRPPRGRPALQGSNAARGEGYYSEELEKKIEAQAADISRREEEVKKLQAKLDSYLAEKTAETSCMQAESIDASRRVIDLQQNIKVLERNLAEAEQKRIEAEEALARQCDNAAGPADAERIILELRNELKDKDAALQGISQQLLEVSTEKDELFQELQKLREAPSAPGTPRALPSKRSFFGRSKSTALERDALALQVHQLEEQLQKLTEKRVDLERTKVKLEGQLTEAIQDARVARNEKNAVEVKLKERESALESLRAVHADMRKPLDAPKNLVLPLPKGRHDAEFEARAQIVLKDGVIKTLSTRLAHLQFALGEVTAEKEKLLSQPATIALRQQLEEATKELALKSAKHRITATQLMDLKDKVTALTAEVTDAHQEIETLRAALDEAQMRITTTADKYKQQSDRYRSIVSSSLSKIDELHDEVSKERNGKILVSKVYRQEMLELRKAAVLAGGIRGDPVRPLSLCKLESSEKMQQTNELPQQLSEPPLEATASTVASPQTTAASPSLGTRSLHLVFPPHLGANRSQTGSCPFRHGMPATVSDSRTDAGLATIPLCYPLGLPVGQDKRCVRYSARRVQAELTDDQRLAANILHSYVREQQWENGRMGGDTQPMRTPSGFASPLGSGARDVEACFTLEVMEKLQQPDSRVQHTQEEPPKTQLQLAQQQLCSQQQQPRRMQQPPHQLQLNKKPSAPKDPGSLPKDNGAGEKPNGTRVLLPHQQNHANTSLPLSPPTTEPPHNPFDKVGREGKPSNSCTSSEEQQSPCASSGEQQRINSVAGTPDSGADTSGDVMRPSEPTPQIDESTVVRDLLLLQEKRKVLFSLGPGARDPLRKESSASEGDSQVDLS